MDNSFQNLVNFGSPDYTPLAEVEKSLEGLLASKEAESKTEDSDVMQDITSLNTDEVNAPDIADFIDSAPDDYARAAGLTSFFISETDSSYTLHNLWSAMGLYSLEWEKELCDGGAKHEMRDWNFLIALQNKKIPGLQVPNLQQCFSSYAALYANKDDPLKQKQVKKVMQMFRNDLLSLMMMTSSAINFQSLSYPNSTALDEVIHQEGNNVFHSSFLPGQFQNKSGWMSSNTNNIADWYTQECYNQLFGSYAQEQDVKNVLCWISGCNPYLRTPNVLPQKRSIVFGVKSVIGQEPALWITCLDEKGSARLVRKLTYASRGQNGEING